MMMWNEEKAQEIIGRHKNSFSLRLTLKVVRIVAAIVFLYFIYMAVVSIIFNTSNLGKKVEFYQKLAIDWTYPEFSSEAAFSSMYEVTPFLTQKVEIPLTRKIGNEDYVVSELNLSKRLLSTFSHVEMDQSYPYVTMQPSFSFDLPYNPNSGHKLNGSDSPNVWDKLERIHEGNVADLAFSTEEYYSPKEIVELLTPYDLHIVWMPLYMGELKQFTEGSWGSGGNKLSLAQQWGLSGARKTTKDFSSIYLNSTIDPNTIEESQNVMLDNMQMMLKENKKLAEVLLNTNHLQERYDYLHDEGFQAYGAVVTGPVKELLKLKDVKEIRSVQLGEITYWNWE